MIYIEKKTDIAAPAVVTDIQPDKIITRLVSQSTVDGAKVGETLWEKVDRKEFYTNEEWDAFVEQTEAKCREYGYAESSMKLQIINNKYRAYLHSAHRNDINRSEWLDYFGSEENPLHRLIKDMTAYCLVGVLLVSDCA